jgi:hypothetical protein
LTRTKTSADATKAAIEHTQRQLADNHLLLLVPTLLQAERDVLLAVDLGNHGATQRHLDEWRDAANRVKTLVRLKNERPDLVERLNEAVALVVVARDALDDKTRTPTDSTTHARDRMRAAGDRANEIVTERLVVVEGASNAE